MEQSQYIINNKTGIDDVLLTRKVVFFLFAFKLSSELEEFRFHFPYWRVLKLRMSLLCSFIPIFH